MPGRFIKDYGIALLAGDFKEKDKLLHIYLRNHGIVKAVAYGAKNSKKRFGGNLEPYHLAFFDLYKSREFFWIKEVKLTKLFINLRRNRLSLEMLFNISRLLTCRPIGPDPNIFKAFYLLLSKLDMQGDAETKIKYYFFFITYFLKKEGVFPPALHCSFCGSPTTALDYNFSHERIAFICPKCRIKSKTPCRPFDADVLNFIRLCLRPGTRFNLSHFNMDVFKRIQNLLLPALNGYLQTDLPALSFKKQ